MILKIYFWEKKYIDGDFDGKIQADSFGELSVWKSTK